MRLKYIWYQKKDLEKLERQGWVSRYYKISLKFCSGFRKGWDKWQLCGSAICGSRWIQENHFGKWFTIRDVDLH